MSIERIGDAYKNRLRDLSVVKKKKRKENETKRINDMITCDLWDKAKNEYRKK